MRSAVITTIPASRITAAEVTRLARSMRRWSAGLMLSGVIGVFSGVVGLALNLLFLLGLAENKGLMGFLSIWLLVLAFPMLWLTSHCLDRVDAMDRAIRLERCRSTGLADDCKDISEELPGR